MDVLLNLMIVLATVAAMEAVTTLSHKYILHGPGWGWHKSHHESHDDLLEANDLYALAPAALSAALVIAGCFFHSRLVWIGVGMTLYGFLYFAVHDGLSHQRWPFRYVPRRGYLKRLVQAHRLHHASQDRTRAVSYGFLYAPPPARLAAQLKTMQIAPEDARPRPAPRSRPPEPRRRPA